MAWGAKREDVYQRHVETRDYIIMTYDDDDEPSFRERFPASSERTKGG